MALSPAPEPDAQPVAALYCRISQDRAGDALGVDRQRHDCEALAERRSWTVGDVFVDDDRSAYSGKPRPAYDRMLEGIKAGRFSALVAWHPDRLHRSPLELESFIDLVNATGVAIATCSAGEYDLSTAAGRMTARVVGAVARHESEQKSERIRRQREQAAASGRPHGGGRRAFGYDPTGAHVVESEAAVIREAATRLLAGKSLRTIARDLNARGVSAASGGEWSIVSLRTMLTGPRLAGLRVFRGEVVGSGNWPPILTRDEHDRIVAVLGNPRTHQRGRPPTSLLGGLLVCGRCGGKLNHSRRTDGARRYLCAVRPGETGCGRLAVAAEPVEAMITEAVITSLDTPALAQALATEPRDADDVQVLEQQLDELADAHGAGVITTREWMRARAGIAKRLEAARQARDRTATATVLHPYVEAGTLRAGWPDLDVETRRSIIASVIETGTVNPAGPGTRFDPARVGVTWRA
jgi:DNA invertase Pin-like site-specific DNA recombinase